MLFIIALILGFISLVLLVFDTTFGIIGLIFCALLVVLHRNRQKARLEQQRHEELVAASRERNK